VDGAYCLTGANGHPQSISRREDLAAIVATVAIGVGCRIKKLEKGMNAGEASAKNILTE